MNRVVTLVVVGFLASACAHETEARPGVPSSDRSSASVPLPDTAFRNDDEATLPSPTPSRFATRRIGSADDEASGARRFHGARVDLDLKSADLANVFRLLADVGHVNIVVAGEVTGSITLRLKHVPWDQALEVVARTRGLDLDREGNVIVVRPATSSAQSRFAAVPGIIEPR